MAFHCKTFQHSTKLEPVYKKARKCKRTFLIANSGLTKCTNMLELHWASFDSTVALESRQAVCVPGNFRGMESDRMTQ
jgi:hypothetical protein